jgi:hypothetical protein
MERERTREISACLAHDPAWRSLDFLASSDSEDEIVLHRRKVVLWGRHGE